MDEGAHEGARLLGLSEKEERSHERELSNFNGHQETISFHTMANENFVVMNRFSTHASGPGVLKRRDA